MRFTYLPCALLLSTATTILAAPHPLAPSSSTLALRGLEAHQLEQLNQFLATRDYQLIKTIPHGDELEDFDGKTAGIFTKIKNVFKSLFGKKPAQQAPGSPHPGNRIPTPPGEGPGIVHPGNRIPTPNGPGPTLPQ